jgi:hypothetical protein
LTATFAGTDRAACRFHDMADYDQQDRAPVIGKEEARQGRPQGFVRYVMYISIALALLGMFVAYLVISP